MTFLMIAIVVIGSTVGDVLCSAGMKRQGELHDYSPGSIMRMCWKAAQDPLILAGIPAMAVSFFALIALLSVTALSFAVPVSASSYVLEVALAKHFLKEEVHWKRWAGAALVTIGIGLLFI